MAGSGIPKTKADRIRELGREGMPVADIARSLSIRYQHVRNVLLRSELLPASKQKIDIATIPKKLKIEKIKPLLHIKPPLHVSELLSAGFEFTAKWKLSEQGQMYSDKPLPKGVGVYAFAKGTVVLYVGVATMGLSKRLYFYGKPGKTQRTSLRLNKIIKNELTIIPAIDIYTAAPNDLEWNGLPIHGSAGLELGLIKKYSLPWNKRSAG
jgi:hypothetical protein